MFIFVYIKEYLPLDNWRGRIKEREKRERFISL